MQKETRSYLSKLSHWRWHLSWPRAPQPSWRHDGAYRCARTWHLDNNLQLFSSLNIDILWMRSIYPILPGSYYRLRKWCQALIAVLSAKASVGCLTTWYTWLVICLAARHQLSRFDKPFVCSYFKYILFKSKLLVYAMLAQYGVCPFFFLQQIWLQCPSIVMFVWACLADKS